MTLTDLIDRCLQRRYRGPSGQLWLEIHRDNHSVTVVPEYQNGRETVTMPIRMFEALGWEEVT